MNQQPPPGDINSNNNNNNDHSNSDDNDNDNENEDINNNNNNSSAASRKKTLNAKLIDYRRNQVFSMSSQGVRQDQIAKFLHISQGQVSLDLNYLRAKAKESLANYLESRFPLYFEECLLGVNDVIRESWNLFRASNIQLNVHDKVQILHLLNSANELKINMASDGSVIEEAIKFTQMAKNKIVELSPDKLHTEENINDVASKDHNSKVIKNINDKVDELNDDNSNNNQNNNNNNGKDKPGKVF